MGDLLDLGGGETAPTEQMAKTVHNPTVTEKLEGNRTHLQQQLTRIDEALAALKANPEIERVLNLIQRASRGY